MDKVELKAQKAHSSAHKALEHAVTVTKEVDQLMNDTARAKLSAADATKGAALAMVKAGNALKSSMLTADSFRAAIKHASKACDTAVDLAVEARGLNGGARGARLCGGRRRERRR